jgi:hypothetical protein
MSPAEKLFYTHLMSGWRASLSGRVAPAYFDQFEQRNRLSLQLVASLIRSNLRLLRGYAPTHKTGWQSLSRIIAAERKHDKKPDVSVIKRIEALHDEEADRTGGRRAVELRAQAILLGHEGLGAVPLLRSGTLAITDGETILLYRDREGELHFPGDDSPTKHTLTAAVQRAQEQTLQLADNIVASTLQRYAMALWTRARVRERAPGPAAPPRPRVAALDPDAKSKPWRTEANVKAIQLLASKGPGELTADDLRVLEAYSGWGGLSIEQVGRQLPSDLIPETFGLIHEYYTPSVIADAIAETLCPFLPELAGHDGVVRALEPSAGIGRLIRAFNPTRCLALEAGGQIARMEWTAVEFSKVSARLLRALRPDAEIHHMPFERWVHEFGPRVAGTFNLIVANPPYGERGAFALEDPDPISKKETRAFAYFMRRSLDLLVPGGIGVFLIPAGMMSGKMSRALRERLLLRNHLLGAYRLPSQDPQGRDNVPGASVVMDLVMLRSRGGELRESDPADREVIAGDYFKQHPGHILGEESGAFSGEAASGRAWRYEVTGHFTGLPPLSPRPICTTCELTSITRGARGVARGVAQTDGAQPEDLDDDVRAALELGERVRRYLAAVGADERELTAALWPELHADLLDFAKLHGDPHKIAALRSVSYKTAARDSLLSAFDRRGRLVTALDQPPEIEPKYNGPPNDIVAQAELLYRQHRSLKLPGLLEFHGAQGGTLSAEAALAALVDQKWNLDGEDWDDLLPADAYLTGVTLWQRHDRAKARADAGDSVAAEQVSRLLAAIKPVVFADLSELSPNHGWIPLDLVSAWVSATMNRNLGALTLVREGGLISAADTDERSLAAETMSFLGWLNHDNKNFTPIGEDKKAAQDEDKAQAKRKLAERRIAMQQRWAESFYKFLAADESRQEEVVYAYNRAFRGRIVPQYPAEPLSIVRWGQAAPQLKDHQIAGARRVLAQRGGLVAFDVGVGKTYTALAVIARARQEGWVRRPVVLVPGSLVWKWHDDVLCTLPDYRIRVIGSKRKILSRGPRKGQIVSETDTPEERARKWIELQTGQLDLVILSYDALPRTKMNVDAVLAYAEQVESIERSLNLRRRNLKEKASAWAKSALTERQRALLEHGTRAWVEETLALPEGWEYDPGVTWDEIGVDMLIVDEAASFKNLHMPGPREDGGVPRFMGSSGDGSNRAWQLDFRAAAVRRTTGGAGIVLLTATPAKNSPLELYNLIQFVDPNAFLAVGIHDPEQFIDHFLKIEYREVLDSTLSPVMASAVTGFINLDELRTLILTYGEFRTAAEVNLKLPRPVVETITVTMDDAQEEKYVAYVKAIEAVIADTNPKGSKNVILGLLARLGLVALHANLDEGYSFEIAREGGPATRTVYDEEGNSEQITVELPRPVYDSPKLVECAKRIIASPHCGHIVFAEPTAVHVWMKEVLIEQGIPAERIAWLNSSVNTLERTRIARDFNGLSAETPAPGTCTRPSDSASIPKYDVVIANSVAYEGIDLQVRTCSIHHLDLPWTPADLEQRNGRGVRQGATFGVINIYYYFADGSADGYRFSLISGKAGWLGEVLKGSVRDTNNPGAQQQLSPEDVLLMISRNKEKTRALLEAKREEAALEARWRVVKEANQLLRQAVARFEWARTAHDPDNAARLRQEAEDRLAELQQVDPEVWPWAPWMYAARDVDMIVGRSWAGPVYEGLRVSRPRLGASDKFDYLEFGRVRLVEGNEEIGIRAAGEALWQLVRPSELKPEILPADMPREGGPRWPEDDDTATEKALEARLSSERPIRFLQDLTWDRASDAFVEKFWPRAATKIRDALVRWAPRSPTEDHYPVESAGRLLLRGPGDLGDADLIPPTRAGWVRYLELAPSSRQSFDKLDKTARHWWSRGLPRSLLADARRAEPPKVAATAEAPATTPAPPPKAATPPPTPPPSPPTKATPAPAESDAEKEARLLKSLADAVTGALRAARGPS